MAKKNQEKIAVELENIKKQFALRAETYNNSANWITDKKLIRAHRKMAGIPQIVNNKALELCCGSGIIGKALLADGWNVQGVDLSAEMLKQVNGAFPTICRNVEELPFSTNEFDLIIVRQALFLTDAKKVLKEVKRVKKKSGKFVLSQTVPFSEADEEWLRKIHFFKQAQMIKFYTEKNLEDELVAAGLALKRKKSLPVRESITRWMRFAPEVNGNKQEQICNLILNAPSPYRQIRRVEAKEGEIFENWNWVIFSAK
jgi:ubiquinone/menaquinone biosynthesis C-methylase UbiE